MAFEDRYTRRFLAFYSYLTDRFLPKKRTERAERKDQGQEKQTEFIITRIMTVLAYERER